MYPTFFKSPEKKTTYSDIVALIKHINSTPMSRKQESPGFFFVDCSSVHCDHSQEGGDLEEFTEISDWTESLDTATHSVRFSSAQSCHEQTSTHQLDSFFPISPLLTPSAPTSTPLSMSPGLLTPAPMCSEDITEMA